jgi:hypothetical protein
MNTTSLLLMILLVFLHTSSDIDVLLSPWIVPSWD